VAAVVSEPESPAAHLVPPDGEDGAVLDGEYGRAQRREDVVSVVPATGHIAAQRTVGVGVRGVAVDRENVSALAELRLDVERLADDGRDSVVLRGLGMLGGGRRLRRGDGRRRRLARLCVRFRVADLDLALR